MNSENTSWYEKIDYSEGIVMEQGDILFDCPYYEPTESDGDGEVKVKEIIHNVVVLTQSCDIANNKVNKIFVAPWLYLSEAIRQKEEAGGKVGNKGKRSMFKHLKDGIMPSHHLLDEDKDKGIDDYIIVDFSNAYVISMQTMKKTVANRGYVIRLLSPYKEHLSQAFARFFMRVGLPSNLINPFE